MDSFPKADVNVAHSVVISGVTNTQSDDEIIQQLRSYGEIKTTFTVTDRDSALYKNRIVEFINKAALVALEPVLPYTYPSRSGADVFVVRSLSGASECSATGPAESAQPPDYLREIRKLAESSGQPFEVVLKGLMDQISIHLGPVTMKEEDEEEKLEEPVVRPKIFLEFRPSSKQHMPTDQIPMFPPSFDHDARPTQSPRISLSANDLNPPAVQRVVVEHIIRKDDVIMQSLLSLRLRTFSGKSPKPVHESDYDSWRSHIDLLSADPGLSPIHITRRIIESLLSPAADLVKNLGPDSLPSAFLHARFCIRYSTGR
ncbi:unnamed protein product [Knipowitschia caucasica]